MAKPFALRSCSRCIVHWMSVLSAGATVGCTASPVRRKAARGGESSDATSSVGSSSGETASKRARVLRRERQEKAKGTLEAKLSAALERVEHLEARVARSTHHASAGDVELVPVPVHLAARARAMIESLEAHAKDCAEIGEDIHYASLASARARSSNLVHKRGNVAKHSMLASDPALDPYAFDRASANRIQRGVRAFHAVRSADVAAGPNAEVFSLCEDDSDHEVPGAGADVDSQTDLSFQVHAKSCVVSTDPRDAIIVGLCALGGAQLEAHRVCRAHIDQLFRQQAESCECSAEWFPVSCEVEDPVPLIAESVMDNIGALESAFDKYRSGVAHLFGAAADGYVSGSAGSDADDGTIGGDDGPKASKKESKNIDKHPAQLEPTGQPGKRAAQRARRKARAWLESKQNHDVYLNLLSELKGFNDLILMALEGELKLERKVRKSRRPRRLAWVLSQQYQERECKDHCFASELVPT